MIETEWFSGRSVDEEKHERWRWVRVPWLQRDVSGARALHEDRRQAIGKDGVDLKPMLDKKMGAT